VVRLSRKTKKKGRKLFFKFDGGKAVFDIRNVLK
jgi:hypothetical protein